MFQPYHLMIIVHTKVHHCTLRIRKTANVTDAGTLVRLSRWFIRKIEDKGEEEGLYLYIIIYYINNNLYNR